MKDRKQQPVGKPVTKAIAPVGHSPAAGKEAYAEIAEKGAGRVRELMDAVKHGIRRDDPAHEQ